MSLVATILDSLGWAGDPLDDLEPARADTAIQLLRGYLTDTARAQIRQALEDDPDWWLPIHHSWGRSIRNLLREAGYGERFLDVENLDDHYIDLVALAAADADESEFISDPWIRGRMYQIQELAAESELPNQNPPVWVCHRCESIHAATQQTIDQLQDRDRRTPGNPPPATPET